MGPQTGTEAIERKIEKTHWSFASRVAFHFCCIYFGLFCLTTQILGGLFPIPQVEIPDPAAFPPIRGIVIWAAVHVFGARRQLVYTGSGSGDKTFDWVLAFSLLAIAGFTTEPADADW